MLHTAWETGDDPESVLAPGCRRRLKNDPVSTPEY
jgi:hypothetical protein